MCSIMNTPNNQSILLALKTLYRPVCVAKVVPRKEDPTKLDLVSLNDEEFFKKRNRGVYWMEDSTDIIKTGKCMTKLATKKRDGTVARGGSGGRISGTFSDYSQVSTDERTKALCYDSAIRDDCRIMFIPSTKGIPPAKLEYNVITTYEIAMGRKPIGNRGRR